MIMMGVGLFLSACGQTLPPPEETSAIKIDALPACVDLLSPEAGSQVPIGSKVTFAWTPLNEASTYQLNLILPDGESVTMETDRTSRDRYLEAYRQSGEYQWSVTPLDADGQPICISNTLSFIKLQSTDNGTKGCGSRGLCPDWSVPDPVTGCDGD